MVLRNGSGYVFKVNCDDADQVFLVGDFNNWSTTATPMRPAGPRAWVAHLNLPPGSYRYGYFIVHNGWCRGDGRARCEAPAHGLTSVLTDRLTPTLNVALEH